MSELLDDEYQEQLRIEASEIELSIERAEVAEKELKEIQRRENEEAFKRIAELEAQLKKS